MVYKKWWLLYHTSLIMSKYSLFATNTFCWSYSWPLNYDFKLIKIWFTYIIELKHNSLFINEICTCGLENEKNKYMCNLCPKNKLTKLYFYIIMCRSYSDWTLASLILFNKLYHQILYFTFTKLVCADFLWTKLCQTRCLFLVDLWCVIFSANARCLLVFYILLPQTTTLEYFVYLRWLLLADIIVIQIMRKN